MSGIRVMAKSDKNGKKQRDKNDVDKYLRDAAGLDTAREQLIGQHIGYRYDVNLLPDYERLTPYLRAYMEFMGWDDLNWLEDVHMGYGPDSPPSSTATSMAGCAFRRTWSSLTINRTGTCWRESCLSASRPRQAIH